MERKKRGRSAGGGLDGRKPSGDYEVGYCRPPAQHTFKKGVSANPSGKAKNPKQDVYSTKDAITRPLVQTLKVKKGEDITSMRAIDAVFQKRLELALKGDRWAIKACCEDAERCGILMDPRITSISHFIGIHRDVRYQGND